MGNSHRNMNDQYVLLNSTNKVETSEPNGCHLFYLNTKCEEKKNHGTLTYCFSSINCYYFS